MKLANKILPFLVIAMLFAIPSFAQFGPVQGKVLDKEGKGLPNAQIVLDRIDLAGHFDVKTDKGGQYRASVPVGRYKISLMQDGMVVDFLNNFTVTTSGRGIGADGQPGVDLAEVNFDLRSIGKNRDANLSAEEKAARDAQKAKSDALNSAFTAGVAALKAKNYEEAITQLQKAAESDPSKDLIFGNLGMAYDGAKKFEDATKAYQKAIELKPTEVAYYNNLGVAYGNAGKIEEASATLAKVGELNPAAAGPAYYNLGVLLTNKGKTKDASDAFKKSIEFDANYADSYYQLGISLMGSAATMKDAATMFDKYIKLAMPGDPNIEIAKQMIEATKGAK